MTREEAIKELNRVFEPAYANYIVVALTEGATVSDVKKLPSVTPKCNPNKNVKTYYFHEGYCPKESEDKE